MELMYLSSCPEEMSHQSFQQFLAVLMNDPYFPSDHKRELQSSITTDHQKKEYLSKLWYLCQLNALLGCIGAKSAGTYLAKRANKYNRSRKRKHPIC